MASIISIAHFMGKYGGISGLLDFVELLSRTRLTHEEIARRYGIDAGQLSKFIKENFDRIYVLKPEVQEAIDKLRQANIERLDEQRRIRARII